MKVSKDRVEIKMGSGSNAVPLQSRYEFFDSDGLCIELDPSILCHLLLVMCDDYQTNHKKKLTLRNLMQILEKQRERSRHNTIMGTVKTISTGAYSFD